ncbi:ketopantoate hydroxymethyltransferase [Mycena floridula]|nr:ketopantoate hydroxymethyltransferase [Mycena floridula]
MSFTRLSSWVPAQRRWMSVRPEKVVAQVLNRKKVTIQTLQTQKASGTPISMLTAYDYSTGLACSANQSIDITLVGDSLAQVCLGYSSTTHLTLSEMIHHARAVARGTTYPLLIADMPFGSYHVSVDDAVRNAVQLVQQGQVEGLKLEGGQEIVDVVRKLTSVGIPVMAHVGLLPQRHVSLSGYRVQGKDAENAQKVLDDVLALEEAGAFSVVLEAIPSELAKYLTERLRIPSIGIGAGPWTDGQVLVWDDAVGTWSGHKAKFVRRFGDLRAARDVAVDGFAQSVRNRTFPDEERESYTMDVGEFAKFMDKQKS